MSISAAIGDNILSKVTGFAGDEYQESMVHKSHTVAFGMVPTFSLIAGAILAWAIPGECSWLSMLVLLPVALPEFISASWLKAYAPRPKGNFKSNWVLPLINLVLALVMVAGIAFNVADGGWALWTGALVGAAVAFALVPHIMARRNQRDEERLNAQADLVEG